MKRPLFARSPYHHEGSDSSTRNGQLPIHLFVRQKAKIKGQSQPFLYGGRLRFLRWDGDKPITIWWELQEDVPSRLREELLMDDNEAHR